MTLGLAVVQGSQRKVRASCNVFAATPVTLLALLLHYLCNFWRTCEDVRRNRFTVRAVWAVRLVGWDLLCPKNKRPVPSGL
jgi:hypothetical protein